MYKKTINFLTKNWKIILYVFLVGLAINTVWEVLHSFLYSCTDSLKEHIPMLVRATFWDAGFIIALYLFMAFLKEDSNWVKKINKKDVILILFVGFISATTVELHALYLGKWGYREFMPLVPYLKVGLTPFLQLAFTSLTTFLIVKGISIDKS
ncbi:MAG: hypothetical protein ACD_19C00216G0002 [uncultured bacterium]|nr:MAG: hypothetical protein ACD_19C00216G0002 [uncultured bacterium]